ncbi:MAG: hypothetical protein K2K32_03395 [Muribaculaceae bacterium]|nr:hypothetical protein [Muribaculaceae bacterium]
MTDTTPDYLYFLTDPKAVMKTNKGFIGGTIMMDKYSRGPGTVGSIYFGQGMDFKDKWVAADFSISVMDNFKSRFAGHLNGSKDGKKFYEPIISFRHIFHITDARVFAEKFSGSYDNNYDYIKNNRRYISARQNADFTIRLEHPMPVEKDTPSELYYRAQDDSYKRVCSYEIRAYKTSTFRANAPRITSTNVDPGSVGLINGENMFEPYHISDDRTSKYKAANSIVDIVGTDKSVIDEREFYRAIYCKASNIKAAIAKTKSNKFLVRVYGKDEEGNIIRIFGPEDKPLIVAEYEVEFLPDEEASFLPEYDESLKENGTNYTHSEAYLDKTFSDPDKITRKAVTFDKYSIDNLRTFVNNADIDKLIYNETDSMSVNVMAFIDDNKNNDRYEYDPDKEGHTTTVKIAPQSGNRLKLPLDWSASNYSFAYNTGGDYNMFRLADHSSATVFQTAASRRTDNPADLTQNGLVQRGTYDRTFYDNNGSKKGMFYYVNAASDPGDIVEINVDKPCAGSTLYVSGWVNEFNDHMPETANLIVNYYANVVNNADTTQITRKIQLHGFETGYVPNGSKGMDQVGVDGYYKSDEGNQGVWMHFYYSFVPSAARVSNLLTEDESVKNYSLVLENNSISSRGADYAIDEIRAYVAPPIVEVEQLDPLCNDKRDKEEEVPINIEVRIPYEALLEAFEISENTDESVDDADNPDNIKTIYFAVVDKKKYQAKLDELIKNTEYDKDKQKSLYQAFDAGVISYEQIHNDNVEQKWGRITFNTIYLKNNGFNKANYPIGHAMYHDVEDERFISFITNPPVKYLVNNDTENRDFMIVIAEDKDGSMELLPEISGIELAEAMEFGTQCCRQADFELKPPTDILIDGVLQGNRDNITCCENQHPVVQVILKDKDYNPIILKEDASIVIDWYAGSREDFYAEEISDTDETSTNGMALWQVLYNFRSDYPTAKDWDQYYKGETYTADEKDEEGQVIHNAGDLKNPDAKSYTKAMRSYLKKLVEEGKLYLNQTSYIFPEVSFDGDETSTEIYVTAIPVDNMTVEGTDEQGKPIDKLICSEPTEVKISVTRTSPVMKNGFASGIEYPKDIVDVPLRSGLKHLDKITAVGAIPEKGSAISLVATSTSDKLVMPLRGLVKATEGVNKFKPLDSDPYCYLAVTDDPDIAYKSVYVENPEKKILGKNSDNESRAGATTYDSEYELPLVGEISLETKIEGSDFNNVKVTFYKDAIKFKEGYYYTFKFPYEEDYDGVTLPEGLDESSMPCHGETYFTIKVVPEYQKWTGNASLNWNNDKNWSRVSNMDILAGSDTPYGIKEGLSEGETDTRFTVNNTYPNTFAYAPLDFTKVIIPTGASYPMLAPRDHSYSFENSDETISLYNGRLTNTYKWISEAPKAIPVENMTDEDKYNTGDNQETTNTQPTVYINYDMAAVLYTKHGIDDNNIYCRPWYANACEQIHFDSNAEILNQQYLDYQKAWVDMEMIPDRWYNVASPLQDVVAGDMYLPKADARQATELFTDINFNTTVNDRFQPAVYQRGWDKGSEKVYNLAVNSNNCPKKESVALASTWSHVYNDVTETYAPGMGFSVKTDVTRIADFPTDGLVKFRFPKNDDNYSYFEDGNTSGNKEHNGNLSRTNKGKLFNMSGDVQTVTLTKATEGSLFLVGNPFMAHLDMAKFLAKNDNIESKFWILTSDRQVGVVMDHEKEGEMLTNETLKSGTMTANLSNTGQLAPMQGFFVQAKDNKTGTDANGNITLSIKFTPDMMAVQAYTDTDKKPILKAPAVSAVDEDIIRVTARNACGACSTTFSASGESAAIIRLSANAEKGYAASEDVEMIDDSNQRGIRRIYTVAGTMASAINQTPDADGVEVGLMAPADSVTVVTFNGLALDDYLLYDTATGEMTQLYDGFELEMTGSVSGRYFLTAGIDTAEIEDSTIRIVPVGHEAVVTAPAVCGELTVRVFDTLGREVANAEWFEQEVRIALDSGIYAVEAIGSDAGRKSAKIQIR